MPGEKGVSTSNHMSKRGQFREQNGQHIQKQGMKRYGHPKRGQEVVSTAKNRAGRGPCVQKGMIVGRKGSICPKRDSSRARNGQHIQKWGRKGFVCPKRDDIGQEMVGVSKKGQEGVCMSKKGQNGAGRGPCVQKGMIPGEKGSARPKTGKKGVCVSKKGRFRARRGQHVQKWGRKGSVHPKRDDIGQEMVGVSKKGAGRCPYAQKGTKRGRKGSAHPKMGQAGVRVSKKG